MRIALVGILFLVSGSLYGQEEVVGEKPLEERMEWVRFGLLGFGMRVGADLEGGGQAVGGGALDLGHVYSERFRIRLVGELGFDPGPNTYVGSIELLYRFTPDTAPAIPYVGTGIGIAGAEDCGANPDCPNVWWQFALGFELPMRDGFSWFIEYHPQDALRRHRIFVGLSTTRRGM